MLIVYFSSATENTKRFVEKLGFPAQRIPLHSAEQPLEIREPYVLICPTYGGGASISGAISRPVPVQVIRFLNDERNRSFLRAVIAGGNTNFGADFAKAGDIIAKKCNVPFIYRFELMGTDEDVRVVRVGLLAHAQRLGLEHTPTPPQSRKEKVS
ncbi:class Ib ribonucleoside-diphosphate reductase assembly flavoprotein NrdI [Corynebacterium sp. sy039]|uniref:class Ib ribonucleoside-diphosphate reductase assembly flavoprotein NrdI n=1 Tax=Corynebacterium sp. sy039 TaxID=2599641 RepID=UPI0011B80E22|nr:class Ib ribonucleoside-diphosphate reductase assembly flavoprotein NrdI [Corynebacterium sp. sy039]QDZ43112.1 class Ib ribonucleoside-diphosphate reductase assembly flavoprotein NrdI [Corynebacterium sp. sy039]